MKEDHTANYFSHGNEEATKLRDALAEDSLEMLIQWLKDGGNVGIHGASWFPLLAFGIATNVAQMLRIALVIGGKPSSL